MAKIYPTKVAFLVADAIRQEIGGKLTLMGLYSGDELIVEGEMPKEVPPGIRGLALPGLGILVTFTGGSGEFRLGFQIHDPSGEPLGATKIGETKIALVKGNAHNLIFPVIPFPIPTFGDYVVEVALDKKKYRHHLRIRHRDPTAELPVLRKEEPARPKPKSPRKRMKAAVAREKKR